MEVIGTKGVKIAGETKTTGVVFAGGNVEGAQTWQQGYNFAIGAGFSLALHEGHAGTLIVKGQHNSGKYAEHINFAVIDDAVMIQSVSQFGSSILSVTTDGTSINIQANYNSMHMSYMLMYF